MNEHYAAVLSDLQARREKLQAEIRDVETMIGAIQRLMGVRGETTSGTSAISNHFPARHQQSLPVANKRFANLSVRWGVLWHLAEFASTYEKTGEIANALL